MTAERPPMGSELMRLLEREARVEKERVLEDARRRVEEIRTAAAREAEEIVATTKAQIEQERQQARTRAQSAASLRAAALLLEAKDRSIQQVFERAAAEVERAAADPARRRALLRHLLEEAAQDLSTEGATLEVAPGDVEAARAAAAALHLSLEIRENPEVRGGVRLTSKDHRALVENTVGSRLQRTRSALVSPVAETLWGERDGAR